MSHLRSHISRLRSMVLWMLLLPMLVCQALAADDLARLTTDRLAVERVYYDHRLGSKPPFAQAMPAALAEKLVKDDLHQETVLKNVYGVEISRAMLAAEASRMDHSTRAPEILAELKAALGNAPDRFAETVVKPILVERLLREKFDDDEALNGPLRRQCESVRAALLAAKTNGASPARLLAELQHTAPTDVQVLTWQLTPRPAAGDPPPDGEIKNTRLSGPGAQVISLATEPETDRFLYFEDLAPPLQRVLRVQLRQAGDVSAVIETPRGFLLYLATEKSEKTLSAGCLFLPKTSFEKWLNQQKDIP